MDEQRFIELINKSMQESAERIERTLGRKPYTVSREHAIKQVEFLQKAKEAAERAREQAKEKDETSIR